MFLYILLYLLLLAWLGSSGRKGGSTSQLALVFLALAFFVGMSDMLGGYDRYVYGELFDRCADWILEEREPFDMRNPIMGYRSEMAYVWWNVIVSHVTLNRYIYILLTTIFVFTLLFFSFREYAENYSFAVLLFMGLWFFFTFTYLRQVQAVSVAWLAYRFIINKKRWAFFLLWYLAYNFHNSAIIFLPLGFIPLRKYSQSTVIIVMAVLLVIGATGLPMSLYGLYGSAGDAQFESRASAYGEDHPGFRWDYLFEVIVFLYFVFQRYDRIGKDRQSLLFLNCAYAFCGVLLLFIHSSNAGRQSWYFLGGLIFLFTSLYAKDAKRNFLGQGLLFVAFVLFFRIVFSWGVLLSPYKTFLTDGYRPGDHIHDKYEYDSNYDNDKFYRDPWILW